MAKIYQQHTAPPKAVLFRIPPQVHEGLSDCAKVEGISLNNLVNDILLGYLDDRTPCLACAHDAEDVCPRCRDLDTEEFHLASGEYRRCEVCNDVTPVEDLNTFDICETCAPDQACEHSPGEDCMFCISCNSGCREDLDDDDHCPDCANEPEALGHYCNGCGEVFQTDDLMDVHHYAGPYCSGCYALQDSTRFPHGDVLEWANTYFHSYLNALNPQPGDDVDHWNHSPERNGMVWDFNIWTNDDTWDIHGTLYPTDRARNGIYTTRTYEFVRVITRKSQ